jgi:cysteine synthase A
LNPSGSVKDRIAKYIVEKAERTGYLKPDSTVVEVSSGNTGISFAMVAALKGYPLKVIMPENMSAERSKYMKALGAEVITVSEEEGFLGALELSRQMAEKDPRIFLPRQFENEANLEAHEMYTGPEIIEQTGGSFDYFAAGIGTGGTLMGIGRAIERAGVNAKVVAVEPAEAPVLAGGKPGKHGIQGLGDGFVPNIVNRDSIDEVVSVSTELAYTTARMVSRLVGIIVGVSSGANVAGALEIGRRAENDEKIVTLLPDRGERYFSTGLYD